MKKIIAFLLVMVLSISLCACGSTAKMTVEELELALQENDENVVFSLEESDNGYTFSYEDSIATYSGTADNKNNISEFTCVFEGVDADVLTNSSYLKSVLQKEVDDWTWAQLRAVKCSFTATIVYEVFGGDSSEISVDEELFSSGNTLNVNGWKLKATIDSDNDSCTIKVEK